ncbi:uncharacterized protein A4U43_C08F14570 [Asparagus officinalis]|uniref:histone-lysine N-methyltransferase EZ1 n=1 Tax=Asparagus officinalis TaxID=4686 RepID=UPI00098DF78B|nr:histone-lysine N-methyltransferase EZ1 [Asparagus officinalis]ONK60124.1 uncharacterized protein A4U43_C08F14570 [Asparagus officinalis]
MATASRRQISGGDNIIGAKEGSCASPYVLKIIDSLKDQVVVDRCSYVKRKVEENKQKLSAITDHAHHLSTIRRNVTMGSTVSGADLLTRRQEDALGMLTGVDLSCGEKDDNSCQEESSNASSPVLFGNNIIGKNATRPIKLSEVSKLPPYTTWIFLDRNQRMAEDQSVVGRRRIYYDQSCGEALICSDSEEDIVDDEEEKKEFGKVEDYILRMTIQEAGLSDDVLDTLAQCLGKSPCEIKARYEHFLMREKPENCKEKQEGELDVKVYDGFLDKDLDASLDSFDNLFCRRCLVFDCRLHGCSQDLVFPVEKQHPLSSSDEGAPCGIHCYRLIAKSESMATVNSQTSHVFEELTPSSSSAGVRHSPRKKSNGGSVGRRRCNQSESASSNARVVSESSESEVHPNHDGASANISSSPSKSKLGVKSGIRKKSNKRVAERVLICMRKRQKKTAQSESDSIASGSLGPKDLKLRSNTHNDSNDTSSSSRNKILKKATFRKSGRKSPLQKNFSSPPVDVHNGSEDEMSKETSTADDDDCSRKEFVDENIYKPENGCKSWKIIEKSLFAKGLEIFGRNSCLIARNLLSGMKTCADVFQYMNFIENKGSCRAADGSNSLCEGHTKGKDRSRSRFMRRRGRVRRLKYTWKSAGYHSIRKRITDRKDQPCKQYNPCGCQTACGKQCPCLLNGTCCEKYCGCPKICKNRFRGCHCAKSQCRSRQCPCFAADRECDPDICRNCWIGCGDGSLGVPSQRGDNYECRNMKLLLKQQQRVLLGRSDVSGWGAFLKNSVGKHEYLGEYTGELISHREADKRGKIYDRENSSFLFNLNDQFVLDAYRKGDKLKFANHSPDPNCYAKVIMVAGDHRVGIFAKERISAGEELFYDYRYEPDRAPAWARKPEAPGSKKDGTTFPSVGRAKKIA